MRIFTIKSNNSDIVLAYMAGIIDGEGSITITDCTKKQSRTFFTTSLGISTTDKVLIDWVVDKFGGWNSSYTPKQTPKNSRKKVYRWQITGENLETLLKLVYPYIVIKKQEIEIMLAMRKTFTKSSKVISPEIIELRKKYTTQIKKIHCRNYNNSKK